MFGNRDERRRRLLAEETTTTATESSPESGSSRSSASGERFAAAAHYKNRLRATDLAPQRPWMIALAFALGVAVVAALEALYYLMPSLAAHTSDGRVAAFDLDGEGSLAVWFSSATLGAASFVTWLVYSVRRHKADDYHGRYRIWFWAAACWLAMSIDECASLHEGFKELMTLVAGTRLLGDGSIWWAGAYFAVLGTIGTRLVLDTRACRASTAALIGTAAAYAVAVAAQLGWLLPQSGARGVMVEEGAEMAGNLLLLLAMTLHLRHVCLDVEGRVAPRKPRKAKQAAAGQNADTAERPASARKRTDLGASTPDAAVAAQRTAAIVDRRPTPPTVPPARPGGGQLRIDLPDDETGNRRLTKAERKALRRMQRTDQEDDE